MDNRLQISHKRNWIINISYIKFLWETKTLTCQDIHVNQLLISWKRMTMFVSFKRKIYFFKSWATLNILIQYKINFNKIITIFSLNTPVHTWPVHLSGLITSIRQCVAATTRCGSSFRGHFFWKICWINVIPNYAVTQRTSISKTIKILKT